MQPFRFALQTSSAPDRRAFRDQARQAEDLGYSTLFVPDHFGDQWGPLVALTVAAEATERLKVGSLVLDNDYRHPVVLAKEIATLDLVSEGRVEFGLGAGWMTTDYEQSGIPLDPPGVRIERMAEGLAIMKAMWSDGRASLAGKHYKVTGAEGHPTPFSRPHPPVIIGGGGKKVLEFAAREADIIGLNPNLRAGEVGPDAASDATAPRYRRKVDWIRAAAGDRFDAIELMVLTFFVNVGGDPKQLAEAMAPMFGLTAEEVMDVPLGLVGSIDEICEQLERRREEYGVSYWVVHPGDLEPFAPVVERLAGK